MGVRHPQYEWVDSAFGNIASRNNPVPLSAIPANVKRVGAIECYATYFRYDKSFAEHVKRNKTVKGFSGVGFADYFPIDIDSPDLNLSLERARKTIEFFINKGVPEEDISIAFSGCKGFHVLLDSSLFDLEPTSDLAGVYKAMGKAMSKELGFDLDPTIYDSVRLFRIDNTINSKSSLYKIPLTVEELFTYDVEEITRMAQTPRVLSLPVRHGLVNDYMMAMFLSAMEASEKPQRVSLPNNKEVTLSNRNAKPCIARLLAGVTEGEPGRNNAALRLAVHYKKEGMGENVVLGLLQGWNELNDPPLPPTDLETVVHSAFTSGYDFGCNDAILQRYCGADCVLNKRKEERTVKSKDMMPLGALAEPYVESLKTTGRIFLGIPEIDKATRGMVAGEVAIIMARPGVGKTAVMLHTLMNKPPGLPAILFSLEMPATQIFERVACMVTGMAAEDLEKVLKDPDMRAEIARAVSEKFQNTVIIDKDALSWKEIEEYIAVAEKEVFKQKVRLVLVDHLGRMRGPGHTDYEIVSAIARGTKVVAKSRDVVLYAASQVGRDGGGDGKDELSLGAARGSGQIEEGADVLLGMWRPEFDTDSDSDIAVISAIKNCKGPRVKAKMEFVRSTLSFKPYTGKGQKKNKNSLDI